MDGAAAGGHGVPPGHHPGVELRAELKSISHRCHLFEMAFVSELTGETIHLPLGCLQGGYRTESVYNVVSQKLIPAQIGQLILYYY